MPINEAMARAKRTKWVDHIERVNRQVVRMMDFRRWNRVYETIVGANPRLRPGIPVLDYFRHVYADYAALAVRRQAKPHGDAISLIGIIEDLAQFPEALTLAWTIDLYGQPHPSGHTYHLEQAKSLAESTFKQFADASGTAFDGSIAEADATRLRAATAGIVAFVDSTIAHDDKKIPTVASTFDELDAAVVLIAELAMDYTLLLTGLSFQTMTPFDQTDSTSVFKFPWIDPEHPPNLNDHGL